MKLEQLGLNFSLLNQEEQAIFFYKYIEKRTEDLANSAVTKKLRKAGSTKGKNIVITSEALETLKGLGLVL